MKQIEQTLSSMEVAEMVGKAHHKLLRDIRVYVEQLDQSKIGCVDFFAESTYKDAKNESRPCFNVTKKGCEFIANKLTGIKGTEFTAKYINKFHQMEEIIKKPISALETLKLTQQAVIEVDEKVEDVRKEVQTLKDELPLLGVDMDRIKLAKNKKVVSLLGGKEANAYKNASLRGRVYKDLEGQIRREFGVTTYKAIKRNQTDKCIEITNSYELPLILKEEIKDVNAQFGLSDIA